MSFKVEENTVCEACGVAGEMGFVIGEGDEVAEVTIFSASEQERQNELAKYVELAKQVCKNVEFDSSVDEESNQLNARFKFEVSAEKLIFELKTRSIAR